ncbi:WYL domain-containing protein [Agrobacterium sp. CR_3]|uniref:DNA-binding transcriptional regulator YafY n=1 Tax=Ensifer adhaerens TaxID=106592 RepID=A0ACC5SPV8_ENSAD|nr:MULTISPECIES: WYL domain-containing protein [Rhizobiaceae]MBP1870739.1 putative DNA-binding transcriptional regulator YafY [Ensifer adhaerens]MRG67125.1 WYL domain-containing protein [Agrobacterium pusense]
MSFAKAQELLKLAMMATRRSGVSLEEIVEEWGCSHRTAQRMMEALQAAFPQTESEDGEDRKRRWRIHAKAIAPLLTPSAEELAAIATAISELEAQHMTAEAAMLRQLQSKVRALLPPGAGTRLAVDEEALLEALGHAARPGPRPAISSEVDAAISEALKGPFLLRIVYRKRTQDKPSERVVAPHGLLLGVRRYLVARDMAKKGGGLQHYRVEEIYSAEVLGESFELDPGFSIRAHAEKGFGSYESAAEHGDVVWRFSPDAAPHARRFVFHPTQTVEEEANGSLLVRFRASGHLEMCWHLYSWGKSVEVLQPARLREMVHGHQREFDALP